MVNGYSRDIEREADETGVHLMAAAGYEPRELASFFRKMVAESPDRGTIETFFYGNHPRTQERIETVERLSTSVRVAPTRAITPTEFSRRILRVRAANASYDAFFGRTTLARWQVDKVLDALPATVRPLATTLFEGHIQGAQFYGAKARKEQQRMSEPFGAAQRAYRKVIAEGGASASARPLVAAAYKGMGHLYLGAGESSSLQCEGQRALQKYLELQPTANDSAAVRERLSKVKC
jgi:hypothetical protein